MNIVRNLTALVLLIGAYGCDTSDPTGSATDASLVTVSGGAKDVTILRESDRHDSLVVQVRDKGGAPLAGINVSWSQTDDSGIIVPAVSRTDANGMASARWTVSGVPGVQRATATVDGGQSQPFTFAVRSISVKAVVPRAGEHRCVITQDDRLACSRGLLEAPRVVLAERRFRDLARISPQFNTASVCAVEVGGSVWCAPAGGLTLAFAPVGGPGFRLLRGGGSGRGTYCGVSLQDEVWCWGNGRDGLRGDGIHASDFVASPQRVIIPGAGPIQTLTVGYAQACALSVAGVVWCWGRNTSMMINPDPSTQYTVYSPIRLDAPYPFAQFGLATNGESACGLLADGRAVCAGDSFQVARAASSRGFRSFDFAEPETRFAAIAPVQEGYIGLGRDGFAYLWGSMSFGDIGGIRTQMVRSSDVGDRRVRAVYTDDRRFSRTSSASTWKMEAAPPAPKVPTFCGVQR